MQVRVIFKEDLKGSISKVYTTAGLSSQAVHLSLLTPQHTHYSFSVSPNCPFSLHSPPSTGLLPRILCFRQAVGTKYDAVPLSLSHSCSPMGQRKGIRKNMALSISCFLLLYLKQGEVSLLLILTPAFGNFRASFCFWSDLFLSTKLKMASRERSVKTCERKLLLLCRK